MAQSGGRLETFRNLIRHLSKYSGFIFRCVSLVSVEVVAGKRQPQRLVGSISAGDNPIGPAQGSAVLTEETNQEVKTIEWIDCRKSSLVGIRTLIRDFLERPRQDWAAQRCVEEAGQVNSPVLNHVEQTNEVRRDGGQIQLPEIQARREIVQVELIRIRLFDIQGLPKLKEHIGI